MDLDADVWSARLFLSVSNLSRTSKGSANTTYAKKPALLITEPAQLREQTAQNLTKAIEYVWERGPSVAATGEDVKVFIEGIAQRISEKLVAPGTHIRTWELSKEIYPHGLSPKVLAAWLPAFYEITAMNLDNHRDSVLSAAWIERIYDGMFHPLPDGCGRVAKLLGAWILLRDGKYSALFEDRDAYYAAMIGSVEVWEAFYRKHVS